MSSPDRPTAREWLLVLRGIVRVMADSNRTVDIHRVAEITSRGRVRTLLEQLGANGLPDLLRDRPYLTPQTVDLPALRRLPADTLGGAYVRHFDRHGLEMYVDPIPPSQIPDLDVRYLFHRYRQVHDIWHVLLGLGTEGHEEVLVHAFVLGHLRLPVSMLIVVLGTLKHGVTEGRWDMVRRAVPEAYRLGRDAAPLLTVRWEHLWAQPLGEVRQRFNIRPCTPAGVPPPPTPA